MSFSLYWENKLLDHSHGVGAVTMPATLYAALFSSNPCPGSTLGVATGTETAYTSYARQLVTFAAAAGAVSANSALVTFPASGSTATAVNYVALYDAVTSGHLIEGYGISNLPIVIGTQPQVAIGVMSSTMSGTP